MKYSEGRETENEKKENRIENFMFSDKCSEVISRDV